MNFDKIYIYTKMSFNTLQNKYDNLTQNDFIEIVESVRGHIRGKTKETILVNLSHPSIIVFNPIDIPCEYKYLNIEYVTGKKVKVIICI